MADLVMVGVMVAFIVICVAYVAWCDRIIGPAESETSSNGVGTPGVGD